MRYYSAPKSIEVKNGIVQDGVEVKVPFTLAHFLDQFVWNDPKWRSSGEWREVFETLSEKLDGFDEKSAELAVEDAEHEKLAEILKGIDFRTSVNQPGLARKLTLMCNCILASPRKPKKAEVVPALPETLEKLPA